MENVVSEATYAVDGAKLARVFYVKTWQSTINASYIECNRIMEFIATEIIFHSSHPKNILSRSKRLHIHKMRTCLLL